ncbi:hypothetical protein QOZ80_3BG0264950 [Eleusine coracana subsp. coracana]|nr:hypothetical protein QOZ80_3BG0264950 [Eleusine coracana subsp. coracana]
MMHLNVPDFDIVTSTVSMPNYIVGGIRRTLEQPQYSSSSSSGYSPCANYKALQQQIIFGGQDDQNGDTHYDSDEAESRLSVLKPEELVDEDNFTEMLLQLSDAPKERNQVYGENGLDTHDVKSQAESVGSLNLGGLDSDSVDSTPLLHSKESCCLTQSATDRCSRTRTTKCSLSSEESNSISSCLALAFDNGMNDLELEDPLAAISELIHDGDVQPLDHSIPRNVEIFADSPNNGRVDLQKDIGIIDRHYDVLACDRESVCSRCEEPRYGLNGELSEWSSGLTPRHDTDGKLPMVSEDLMNNTEPSTIPVTGMTSDVPSQELKPEFSTEDNAGDKSVPKSEDIASSSISPDKAEGVAPKSGKGVLKSVAGGITFFGVVLFIVHLRRGKERSFTSLIPWLSEKSVPSEDSRAKNKDKGKAAAVYPGEWLKI